MLFDGDDGGDGGHGGDGGEGVWMLMVVNGDDEWSNQATKEICSTFEFVLLWFC